ncbi:4-hydroxy-tetrahydrodipicolinate reductase [Pelagibacterium montanilacus]|uniref:4-hydroxy-tetrahydrodipicolinate reductase n=1 Tax=Pelagibacterium montanilacus TaxID=2185280 RepID=UPI000F8EB857|nr:4-hydroxy-tetrahydrodipicolinate reductase [Pelagibacterium montanilacus]
MTGLKIAIAGAGGRMGAANIRAVLENPACELVAAFDRSGAPAIGRDAGTHAGLEPAGIAISEDIEAALSLADAVIDFTAPAASVALARQAAEKGMALVIGTTGCSSDDDLAIAAAGEAGARIVKSGNMSLGVNLLAALVRKASAALGEEFDIEVLEMHHRHKVDAPSGTALMLGEAAAQGRGVDLSDVAVYAREGHTGPRRSGDIGFATLRGGGVIGDHSVILASGTERITLGHAAQDRQLFAQGAVRAALWAGTQGPGLYDMTDVLGLKD